MGKQINRVILLWFFLRNGGLKYIRIKRRYELSEVDCSNTIFKSSFLVGAFLGKRSRLLQWLVFFLFFSSDHRPHRVCTTFYRLHSRSHVLVSTRFTVNPAVTGSSPCFSQKLFRAIFFGTVRLSFFSALCDFFFEFFVSKGSPLQVF